jgi:transcriptional regulator with XRE-family HTH domain
MAVIMRTKRLSGSERLKEDALGALSTNVVVYRAQKRLSQIQLAGKSGVSRPVVSKIEQGVASPSLETLSKIASALGRSIADLFEPLYMGPVSDEEIRREIASGISDDDIDVDFLLKAIDETKQTTPRPMRYSPRGRKPAVAHHRKKPRR